jgi:hypothetical protein
MLTQPPIHMISASPGSQSGDVVTQQEGKLGTERNIIPVGAGSIVSGRYDATTGTLHLNLGDGRTLVIKGFATEQTVGLGPKGNRGPLGKDGRVGKNGLNGREGLQGCPGVKGDKGEIGPNGTQGPEGPVGEPGNQGIQGSKGVRGPTGNPGQEPIYVYGTTSSQEHTVQHGRVMLWGHYMHDGSVNIADVRYPQATSRLTQTIICFFSDSQSMQAQNYSIEAQTNEGFTLRVPDSFILPLSDSWDFQWIALGD